MGGSCFKIGHEKFRARYADDQSSTFLRNMAEVLRQHPDLRPAVQKSVVSKLLLAHFSQCVTTEPGNLNCSLACLIFLMITLYGY
jgi:hypothetical protein